MIQVGKRKSAPAKAGPAGAAAPPLIMGVPRNEA